MRKNTLLLSAIIVLLLLFQPISAQTWTATKRLTWNSEVSRSPAIAAGSDNHIHVVWSDSTPGNCEIYYKRYLAVGFRWITKRLTHSPGDSFCPAIAVESNNHIYVVWQEEEFPGNYEIYYKKSTDGGATWTTKRLTYNSDRSREPIIAVDSNNYIHVVWYDEFPGNYEIYYKKSKNGGSTWTTKRLTWSSGQSLEPAIAIDSNNHIHLVWCDGNADDYEIYYMKSEDGGSSWSTKQFTFNSGFSGNPAITVDSSDHIHVVWKDEAPGNMEIYYKKSTDGGATWTTKRLTYNSGGSHEPIIAVDSNNYIHVVWYDETPGNYEIYYKKSMNGGTFWTTKRLTYNPDGSYKPAITVDSNDHIYVVWENIITGNFEIYYKKGIQ